MIIGFGRPPAPNLGRDIRNFVDRFSKAAFEGAAFTGSVMIGPHLLKRMLYSGLGTPTRLKDAVAWTVAGAIGYASYKTIYEPLSKITSRTASALSNKISNYAASIFFPRSRFGAPTSSASGTITWGVAILSWFCALSAGSDYVYKGMGIESSVPALLTGTLLTSWTTFDLYLALQLIRSNAATTLRNTQFLNDAWSAGNVLWNSASSLLHYAGVGALILGTNELRKNYLSPMVHSEIVQSTWDWMEWGAGLARAPIESFYHTVAAPLFGATLGGISMIYNTTINGTETLKNCTLNKSTPYCAEAQVFADLSGAVNTLLEGGTNLISSAATHVSSTALMVYDLFLNRAPTLEKCLDRTSEFAQNNTLLCGRTTAIKEGFETAQKAVDTVTSPFSKAWAWSTKTASSLYNLGFNRAATLIECEKGTETSKFVCDNARSIENASKKTEEFIQPVKTFLGTAWMWGAETATMAYNLGLDRPRVIESCKDAIYQSKNELLCSRAEGIDQFAKSAWENASWIKDKTLEIGSDPTFLQGAALVAITGIALYALHFASTKISSSMTGSSVPLFTPPVPSAPPIEEEEKELAPPPTVTTLRPPAINPSYRPEDISSTDAPLVVAETEIPTDTLLRLEPEEEIRDVEPSAPPFVEAPSSVNRPEPMLGAPAASQNSNWSSSFESFVSSISAFFSSTISWFQNFFSQFWAKN